MSPTGLLSAAVAEVAPDEFEDVWLLAHPDITAAAARTAAAAITMRRYVLMAPLLKLVAVDPLRRIGKRDNGYTARCSRWRATPVPRTWGRGRLILKNSL